MAVLATIPIMSLIGNQLLDGLRATVGAPVVLAILALAVAVFGGCASYPVLRWGDRSHWRWLAVGFTAGLGVLVMIPPGPRWMHPVLFMPLGWTSERRFGLRLAVVIVAVVGGGDESLQYSLAYRTGSLVDVTANTLAGLSGIALARAARADAVLAPPNQ